ncbi:uncharacterized protein [Penaeus vannamei]|uniref:uncharacterized protein n=1 Tax=Penaeus vannamei TaxID=6689 RepID=UPI00387F9B38
MELRRLCSWRLPFALPKSRSERRSPAKAILPQSHPTQDILPTKSTRGQQRLKRTLNPLVVVLTEGISAFLQPMHTPFGASTRGLPILKLMLSPLSLTPPQLTAQLHPSTLLTAVTATTRGLLKLMLLMDSLMEPTSSLPLPTEATPTMGSTRGLRSLKPRPPLAIILHLLCMFQLRPTATMSTGGLLKPRQNRPPRTPPCTTHLLLFTDPDISETGKDSAI